MSSPTSTSSTTTTTTTTTTTSSNHSNNKTPPPPIDDKSADRIKKRDPGRITKVIKCGVVGDGTVGKTTLLLSYITQAFITEYTPTVFDNFSAIEEVEDGKLVNVILWDTAGQDDYAQIRTTCYTNCKYDVFLLCFSCVNRDSFDNVKYKWLPELKANSPGTPFILVGTKTDMRDTNSPGGTSSSPPLTGTSNSSIPSKEGQKRAKEIKAHSYMECSSKDPSSVAKVVLEAINIVIEKERLKRISNEKLWKKEVKKEEKEAKLEQKARAKAEQQQSKATTTTTTTTTTQPQKKSPSSSPPKSIICILVLLSVIGLVISQEPKVTTLQSDLPEGGCTGKNVQDGDIISVAYVGLLENGQKFDSTADHDNKPFTFVFGKGKVIKGWESEGGVRGMCVGEKKKFLIPYELGYGEQGVQGTIPPKSNLIFDVEVLNIERPSDVPFYLRILPTRTSLGAFLILGIFVTSIVYVIKTLPAPSEKRMPKIKDPNEKKKKKEKSK
eukprot:gene6249-7780_t